MLQQSTPENYVLSSGNAHSVKEFVEIAFRETGISIHWEGSGKNEVGKDKSGRVIVDIDDRYFRPAEVDLLVGDPSRAKNELGWEHKVSLEELVKEMVQSDLQLFKRDKYLLDGGHDVYNYHE